MGLIGGLPNWPLLQHETDSAALVLRVSSSLKRRTPLALPTLEKKNSLGGREIFFFFVEGELGECGFKLGED